MEERTNFQNISDEPGAHGAKWGVKVQARNGHSYAGRTVTVRKRDGGTSQVKLGRLISRWNYANTQVGVYTIVREPRNNGNSRAYAAPTAGEAIRADNITAAQRAVDEAEAAWEAYNPRDYEYFDGEVEIQQAHEEHLRDRIDEARRWLADALREG